MKPPDSRFMSAITYVIEVLHSYYSNSNAGVFVTAVFEDLSDHFLSLTLFQKLQKIKNKRIEGKRSECSKHSCCDLCRRNTVSAVVIIRLERQGLHPAPGEPLKNPDICLKLPCENN